MRGTATALFLLALAAGAPALAAGDPDAAKGLVVEHCIACHEVPGYARAGGPAELDAPGFAVIAGAPESYTPARLRAFLRQPHWPMGGFTLSPRDIENILAFIARLGAD